MFKLMKKILLIVIGSALILLSSCSKDDNTKRKYYFKVKSIVDSNTNVIPTEYKYFGTSLLYGNDDTIRNVPRKYNVGDTLWVWGLGK